MLIALAMAATGDDDDALGISKAITEISRPPGEQIYPGEWSKALDFIQEGRAIDYVGASGSVDLNSRGDIPSTTVIFRIVNGEPTPVK